MQNNGGFVFYIFFIYAGTASVNKASSWNQGVAGLHGW